MMNIEQELQADPVEEIIRKWNDQRPDLDVSPLRVIGNLQRAYFATHASIAKVYEQYGLNNASFDVLATLRRSGSPYRMSSSDLAQSALVTNSGITQRLDRLEKAALVCRERDEADRRIVYAQLTPTGLKLIDAVAGPHFANEARILQDLNKEEQDALAYLLFKVTCSAETNTPA